MSQRELVGVAEIAERAGVTPQAVWMWQKMPHMQFPEPIARLAATPVWEWPTVKRWLDNRRGSGRPRKGDA